MPKENKEKKFLKVPQYPGGKEAFSKFIRENLIYPPEAIAQRIEGFVYIKYHVSGLGDVVGAEAVNGIGYGCDEEAVRVVKLMKFDKAKNRGLRVISTMRTKIEFRLPPLLSSFNYQSTTSVEKRKRESLHR